MYKVHMCDKCGAIISRPNHVCSPIAKKYETRVLESYEDKPWLKTYKPKKQPPIEDVEVTPQETFLTEDKAEKEEEVRAQWLKKYMKK